MTESLANRERNYMRFVSWNVNGLRAVLKKGFDDNGEAVLAYFLEAFTASTAFCSD